MLRRIRPPAEPRTIRDRAAWVRIARGTNPKMSASSSRSAGEFSASASGCRTETRDRPLAERASRGRLLALSGWGRSTVQLGAHFERALFQLQRLRTRLGQVRLVQLVDLR